MPSLIDPRTQQPPLAGLALTTTSVEAARLGSLVGDRGLKHGPRESRINQ
jgi:hypothetical protein